MTVQLKKQTIYAPLGFITRSQDGGAMIMALMIMAILSIIGISVTNTSITELHITSNVQAQNMAMYSADAGVQYTLAMLKPDLKNILLNQPTVDNPSTYAVNDFSFEISPIDWPWTGAGPHRFTSTGSTVYNIGSNEALFVISVSVMFDDPLHPAFGVGIVSDGDIDLTGVSIAGCGDDEHGNIIEDCGILVHANEDVSANNATVYGGVSAHGTITGNIDGDEFPGSDRMDIPSITDADFNAWRSGLQLPTVLTGSDVDSNTYTLPVINKTIYYDANTYGHHVHKRITFTGVVENAVIFVDGNVVLSQSARFANVTIIATGNVTINGKSGLTGTVIAGRNLNFNGSSGSVATLWANGDIDMSGTSEFRGTITASSDPVTGAPGDIRALGGVEFERSTDDDNEYIPRQYVFSNISWADARLID